MNTKKRTPYRVCPECGSNLDPGEPCDCKRKHQPAARCDAAARRGQLENYRVAMYRNFVKGSYR